MLGNSASLLADHDVVLLDLDGVLYRGDEPVQHAAAAVAAARAAGVRAAFVTNNASRAPSVVAEQLTSLDIPATADEVVTAAQAAAQVLAQRLPAGARVLVVGTEALVDEVRAVGLQVVTSADDAPQGVAQGLSQTVGYRDVAEAALAVRAGALWVTANTDPTVPSPRGLLPGNGAWVATVAAATGRAPLVAGKPEPALHAESVRRSRAQRPLVVGDRLDTDIAGARRNGSPSLLVLTGVTELAELLAAPLELRPTYVSPDLRGLLLDHRPIGDRSPSSSDAGESVAAQQELDALRARVIEAWARP